MKNRKLISLFLAFAFIGIVSYNIYSNRESEKLSNMVLSNVEALAQSEGQGNYCCGCYFNCFLICSTYGDWGACLGQWDHMTYFC